jgi:CrcB protein
MESTTVGVARTPAWSGRVLVAVAGGGALGATARWAIGESWQRDAGGWPWATLIVNLLGCVAIGHAARRLTRDTVAWALVVTGVLGGFTTFSAFAVEVADLLRAGPPWVAAAYVAVSVLGGLLAVAAGLRLVAAAAGFRA